MDRVQSLIRERKKKARKNIVIKKWDKKGPVETEQVEAFLREKMGVNVKVVWCRQRGSVIVVKLLYKDQKREVMSCKNTLKREVVFVKIDLTWEERRVQARTLGSVRKEKG